MASPEFPTFSGVVPNSAVFQPDNRIMDNFWKQQEAAYRDKVFSYKKAADEADKKATMLDFDTSKIRPADKEELGKQIYDFGDFANSDENVGWANPTIADRDSQKKVTAVENKHREVATNIARSKQIEDKYWTLYNELYKKGDVEGIAALKEWYQKPLSEIGNFDYTPAPDYNPMTVVGEMVKDLDTTPTVNVVPNPDLEKKGEFQTTTVDAYDPDKLKQAAAINYKFNVKGTRDAFDRAYNEQTPEGELARKTHPSAQDYAIDVLYQYSPKYKNQKADTHGIYHPPQGSGGKDESSPEFNWIVDNAVALSNPASPIYSEGVADKSGKQVGKLTHVFDGLVIPVGGKNDKGEPIQGTIRAIYNIGGKIYAKTGTKEAGTGFTSTKDLVEITNRYGQLVTKYINQEYGSSPTTAKAIQAATNYAREVDQNNELGLPQGTSTSGTTKEKTYSLNGKPYTISDITAAAKASGMTVDEYIKAAGLK